ncbi:MAG: hypothetical protein JSS09_07115 [Verrucomicrobia bacterium]|nr:hypothetical protein [Verrucomicrobiota bacterium]
MSKRMASSKELTPERIDALRKMMEAKAKELDTNKKQIPSSQGFQEIGPPDPDFSFTQDVLAEQAAVDEFVRKVFESVEKDKKS